MEKAERTWKVMIITWANAFSAQLQATLELLYYSPPEASLSLIRHSLLRYLSESARLLTINHFRCRGLQVSAVDTTE